MINGVLHYDEFTASVYFERDHVACVFCPMLSETPRYQCRMSGEYVTDIKSRTGNWCPLQPKEPPND